MGYAGGAYRGVALMSNIDVAVGIIMGDHVALVGMIPEPAHILDQLALMRHQRIVNGNDPTHAVARLRRLLQPCQSLVIERRDIPVHLGQPAVQARLVGREYLSGNNLYKWFSSVRLNHMRDYTAL